jgi:hypothetical protein
LIESWSDAQRAAFPIVWTRDGGRSAWLDTELAEDRVGVLAESGHRA